MFVGNFLHVHQKLAKSTVFVIYVNI